MRCGEQLERDRERVTRSLETGSQHRKPLVSHQHQVVHLGPVVGRRRIETRRAVFDRIKPVARHRLTGIEPNPLERLGAEPLDRISVNGS